LDFPALNIFGVYWLICSNYSTTAGSLIYSTLSGKYLVAWVKNLLNCLLAISNTLRLSDTLITAFVYFRQDAWNITYHLICLILFAYFSEYFIQFYLSVFQLFYKWKRVMQFLIKNYTLLIFLQYNILLKTFILYLLLLSH